MRGALFAMLLTACMAAPPPVTAADAERAHVELATLQEGRSLVLHKCGGCHKTPMPTDHLATEWPLKIDEMADRAHLDADERRMISAYLVAMAH